MNFVTMAGQRTEDGSSTKEGEEVEKEKQKKNVDPELLSCLLQPMSIGVDPDYIGIRRLLLYRKAEAAVLRRKVCFPLQLYFLNLDFCFCIYFYLIGF